MLRAAFSHKNDGLALKLEGRPFGALEAIPNKLMQRRS
jgi:hypothetical protein